MKKFCLLILSLCCLVVLAGCSPQNAATQKGSGSAYAVLTDDLGRQVTLEKKPQRVVALSTSLVNFTAAVDGDLAGRPTLKSEDASLPDKYKDVPDVGPVYNVSVEKIVAAKPDLVLASADHHQKIISQLEDNHIPVLVLKTKTYDDVKRNLEMVGKVYGKEEAAKAKEKELDQQLAAITKAVPQEGKRIAIIHATPSAVSVELPTSIAGDIAKILHLQNVADGTPGGKDATRIPYSMESLVQADPDVIFFTSMGSSDKIEKRIKDDVESNPAWASLTAVKEGRVYVLPENYFLLNPGLDYPQAVAYMANLVYPEAVHE
ncbi:ABC transporter substrate-binding protein [uncultured Megasphaera sp.]|uniref:ABC transporter substrate-binding protein n=1 Tax=uncultured Megasphaera sp. TaxID=165188 RepID=UPI0025FA49D1|nr:ABC transporter substrate-binding protein [uncultured Megasphaera sp.]